MAWPIYFISLPISIVLVGANDEDLVRLPLMLILLQRNFGTVLISHARLLILKRRWWLSRNRMIPFGGGASVNYCNYVIRLLLTLLGYLYDNQITGKRFKSFVGRVVEHAATDDGQGPIYLAIHVPTKHTLQINVTRGDSGPCRGRCLGI